MYSLIRKAIFSLDPETAHDLVIKSLHLAGKSPCQFLLKQLLACPQGTPKQVMGITFKNPIGLAAGADKNAEAIDGFGAMGFGFIEVGTGYAFSARGKCETSSIPFSGSGRDY